MRSRTGKSGGAGILVLGATFTLASCSGENRIVSTAPEVVRDVPLSRAAQTTIRDELEAVGTVSAARTSEVASQIMGNILEIRAREGDHVQSGELLATIDDARLRAAVAGATAAVTAAQKEIAAADSAFSLAEATLKRYQQLFDKKSVSPQEFDEVKARFQSAEARRDAALAGLGQANAELAQAQASLSYTTVRAPFAGVITEKKADPGTLASPGMVLFTVEDTQRFRFEVTVDESDIRVARQGQSIPVTVDALGDAPISGKVTQIVPAADRDSHSFLVKLDLPITPRLHSGLFGTARFPAGERQGLLIPQASIVERGQLHGLFVLDGNQVAQLRYVTLGRRAGAKVEVLSGLQAGENFVAAPGDREWSGKQIAARP